MTNRKLPIQILLFSIPLVISNVLQVLFNMADIAVVGRFAGSLSLAAVGSTATAVTLFTGILIGFSSGVNALVARHFGAKDDTKLTRTVHTAALISLLLGVLLLLFGLFGSRWLLTLLGTKPELVAPATLYMQVYFLGMPALAIFNFGNAVFSAIGNTKKPLAYLLTAGVLNVILNLFFVIVCRLDVVGVALASAISQYLSAILILIALLSAKGTYKLRISSLCPSFTEGKEIIVLGIPAAIQYSIFYIANLFIQAGVNTFDTVTVAGNSAAANADGLVYDVMAAFYTACTSFIGQAYGAGEKKKILRVFFICLAFSFFIGILMGVSLVIFGKGFLAIFTKDTAVVAEGMKRLTVMGLSYGFSAFMDTSLAAARGIGRAVVPMVFVILGSCVFRIVWVYTVFAYFGTLTSLYLLYIFSWTITAALENWHFFKCYKKI